MNLMIIANNFAPYHHARLKECAKIASRVVGVQLASKVNIRDWSAQTDNSYEVCTIYDGELSGLQANYAISQIKLLIEKYQVTKVCLSGYSHPVYRGILEYCYTNNIKTTMFTETKTDEKKRNFLRELYKSKILKKVDWFFTSGTLSAAYLTKLGVPHSKIDIGYSVVDNKFFSSYELTQTKQVKSFLYVGRLSSEKGLTCLIKAYDLYSQNTKVPWKLQIVGSGPQEQTLKEIAHLSQARELVDFIPFAQKDQLRKIYHKCDCLILPSTYEPWGLVINEAMACGKPIIASNDCGAAIDLVHHEVNGIRFTHSEQNALQNALEKMSSYDNERLKQMGIKSQELITSWNCENWAQKICARI